MACRDLLVEPHKLWIRGWVAVGEAAKLEDEHGVDGLAEGDAKVVLVHLDAQVEGKEAKVAHLEE